MRRAHDPSGLRGRGRRLRRHPQQQARDARRLRRQRQLAAGDEIELPGLAPDFQHHAANRIAGQRIGGGPQRGVHIGRAHGHQQTRIEAEFGQSAHRHRARFNFGEILPHPHQRPARRRPSCKPCDESRRRGALPSLGEHLVHRAYREAALAAPHPRPHDRAPPCPAHMHRRGVSMRSMLPRKVASVLVRAPVMRRSFAGCFGRHQV